MKFSDVLVRLPVIRDLVWEAYETGLTQGMNMAERDCDSCGEEV